MVGLVSFRREVRYYIKSNFSRTRFLEASLAEQEKISRIEKKYQQYTFGIDVSHYQGTIDWSRVKEAQQINVPIQYAFIRATMGGDKDANFRRNWRQIRKSSLLRGAYHYYRPDENSLLQAESFIQQVQGFDKTKDLPPVLDIEARPTVQSMDNLRKGLKRWLQKVEQHYGVKPIIYTGDKFYNSHLKDYGFDQYPLWIANYNYIDEPYAHSWSFWQFSEKGKVKGITEFVDLNVYKGPLESLRQLGK
ncbi:glycoside hydrolase family 25 protein [Algivirga pacifica]|uniref:Glycoside hydrolase family 25 protein n=2 Tax=Algivirga pacifica TaxID=1162670 RepID=A0ABP9D8N4_9BACT